MKRTDNITWQEQDDRLVDLYHQGVENKQRLKLAHAINLYSKHEHGAQHSSDSHDYSKPQLAKGLSTVIQSMRESSDSLWRTCDDRAHLIGIATRDDLSIVPPDFEQITISAPTPPSEVSDSNFISDVSNLPRLFDLLDAIKNSESQATHVVFTNSDIHLHPWFYEVCRSFLQSGYDSLIINRRTIEDDPAQIPPGAPSSLRQAESGSTHPGLDCFVFPRVWLDQFVRTDAIIGRGAVMRSLLFNMVALANHLLVLSHAQMTYHFGDDRPWMLPETQAARRYNKKQAADLWLRLAQSENGKKHLVALGKLFPHYFPEVPKDILERYF